MNKDSSTSFLYGGKSKNPFKQIQKSSYIVREFACDVIDKMKMEEINKMMKSAVVFSPHLNKNIQ